MSPATQELAVALGGALLALVVVVLFLVRARPSREKIGSVLLWRRVVARRAARATLGKLERPALLALHLVALAAVMSALFFATRRSPTRLVVVLDASASMAATEAGVVRIDVARAIARSALEQLSPGDRAAVVVAGGRARVAAGWDAPEAKPRAAIEAARAGASGTLVREGLELAYGLLASADVELGARREVLLVSDGACAVEGASPPSGVTLRFASVGQAATPNVSVQLFSVRPVPRDETLVEPFVVIKNGGPKSVRARPILELDGAPLARGPEVELEAGASARLALRPVVRPATTQVLGVKVHADGDALALDDRASVMVPARRELSVLLVSPRPEPFVEAALRADPAVRLTVETGLAPATRRHDVLVLAGGASPGGPDSAPVLALGGACGLEGLLEQELVVAPEVREVESGHAVDRAIAWDDVVIARVHRLSAGPGWRTVVNGDRAPLVLSRGGAGGRALVLAFDPADSDLPLRKAWPLLVSGAVRWLAGEDEDVSAPVRAGAVARIALGPHEGEAIVRGPSGETTRVAVEQDARGDPIVTFAGTDVPGVHEVTVGSAVAARFTVAPLDGEPAELGARTSLGLGEVVEATQEKRSGAAVVPFLAAAATLFLLVEAWLFHARGVA